MIVDCPDARIFGGNQANQFYIVAIFSYESSNYFLSCEPETNDQSLDFLTHVCILDDEEAIIVCVCVCVGKGVSSCILTMSL